MRHKTPLHCAMKKHETTGLSPIVRGWLNTVGGQKVLGIASPPNVPRVKRRKRNKSVEQSTSPACLWQYRPSIPVVTWASFSCFHVVHLDPSSSAPPLCVLHQQSALPLILAYKKGTSFQRMSGSPTSAEAARFLQATTVTYDQGRPQFRMFCIFSIPCLTPQKLLCPFFFLNCSLTKPL